MKKLLPLIVIIFICFSCKKTEDETPKYDVKCWTCTITQKYYEHGVLTSTLATEETECAKQSDHETYLQSNTFGDSTYTRSITCVECPQCE